MNRLPPSTIQSLCERFCGLRSYRGRQNIIDQLGTHPVNHAAFIKELMIITEGNWARHWEAYLRLTAAL